MPVNSFHWFNHHGTTTIAPCSANIISEHVFFFSGGGGSGGRMALQSLLHFALVENEMITADSALRAPLAIN